MTPAQRASEFPLEFCPAGEGHDPGVDRAIDCQKCREGAFRAAADEALERAAKAIEEDPAVESGAVMDGPFFADIVRALKTGGTR